MKKETRQMLRELAFYSSLGFSVAPVHFYRCIHRDSAGQVAWDISMVHVYFFLYWVLPAAGRNILLAVKKSKKL